MEKAWAKLFGSYEAIAGGQCSDALNYLTGGLTFNAPDKPDEVWAALTGQGGVASGSFASAACRSAIPEETLSAVG